MTGVFASDFDSGNMSCTSGHICREWTVGQEAPIKFTLGLRYCFSKPVLGESGGEDLGRIANNPDPELFRARERRALFQVRTHTDMRTREMERLYTANTTRQLLPTNN